MGLTAYGIMEFTDMSRVHPVDQAMIDRARKWFFSQQNTDGSWDWTQGLQDWTANRSDDGIRGLGLGGVGRRVIHPGQSLGYLRSHPEELSNNYPKALAANAFLARNGSDSFGRTLPNN